MKINEWLIRWEPTLLLIYRIATVLAIYLGLTDLGQAIYLGLI